LDLKRLSHYAKNLADHHLVSDLLPKIAGLYFNGQMGSNVSLDLTQAAILLGVGLQGKGVDETANELGLPVSQGYALLNKAIRR
jgi:N-acetyltransferase 10